MIFFFSSLSYQSIEEEKEWSSNETFADMLKEKNKDNGKSAVKEIKFKVI